MYYVVTEMNIDSCMCRFTLKEIRSSMLRELLGSEPVSLMMESKFNSPDLECGS